MSRPRSHLCRALPAVLAAALLLGGCGLFGGDRGSDAAPTSAPRSTTTSTTIPAPTLDVLDAGTEPRRELRLSFSPGATTTVVVTTRIGITQRSGSSTSKLRTPSVRETIAFTVDDVTDGKASVTFTFKAVGVVQGGTDLTDAEVAELDDDLQALTGLGGTATIDDRGQLTALSYALPDDLDASSRATLRQVQDQLPDLSIPLPEEAVGVGARWRATRTVTVAGTQLVQEITYTATGLSDTELAYTSTITQTGAAQDLTVRGLPPGTTAQLVSSRFTGTGAGSMPLTSIVATAHAALTGAQVIDTTTSGDTTRLTQDVAITTDVAPAT